MKKVSLGLLFGLLIALLLSPSSSIADNDAQKDVLAVVKQFQTAGVRGDAATLGQIFDSGVTHFHPGSPYRFIGKERLVKEFASSAPGHQDMRFEMLDPQVQMAARDVAVVTYYIDEGWTEKNGARTAVKEKASEVYVNRNGRWLMIHGHYSAE